jgi:hypothetical protein
MDERGTPTVLANRFAEPRAAVDDEECRAVEIEAACAEIGEEVIGVASGFFARAGEHKFQPHADADGTT